MCVLTIIPWPLYTQQKKAKPHQSLHGEVSFGVIIRWTVTHCYRWPAARGQWDAVSGQEKQSESRHRKTILADLWAELINSQLPAMDEWNQTPAALSRSLSVVGRRSTHAHTHSEISLRKAACYLQPFSYVLFFIAIVFDTTLCVKEPLISASPLFFHSPVSFTSPGLRHTRALLFLHPSVCSFSHPFHFFQHVGLVCIAPFYFEFPSRAKCVSKGMILPLIAQGE